MIVISFKLFLYWEINFSNIIVIIQSKAKSRETIKTSNIPIDKGIVDKDDHVSCNKVYFPLSFVYWIIPLLVTSIGSKSRPRLWCHIPMRK